MAKLITKTLQRNWKVLLFFVLFLAMFVLAPQDDTIFIYTEF